MGAKKKKKTATVDVVTCDCGGTDHSVELQPRGGVPAILTCSACGEQRAITTWTNQWKELASVCVLLHVAGGR